MTANERKQLIFDLWWFIENVNDETPDRTERFFALRERVRKLQGTRTTPAPVIPATAADYEMAMDYLKDQADQLEED